MKSVSVTQKEYGRFRFSKTPGAMPSLPCERAVVSCTPTAASTIRWEYAFNFSDKDKDTAKSGHASRGGAAASWTNVTDLNGGKTSGYFWNRGRRDGAIIRTMVDKLRRESIKPRMSTTSANPTPMGSAALLVFHEDVDDGGVCVRLVCYGIFWADRARAGRRGSNLLQGKSDGAERVPGSNSPMEVRCRLKGVKHGP